MPTWVRCFTGKILNLKIESIPTHIYEEIGWSKYNRFFKIYYVVKSNVRDFILVGSNISTCNSCLNKNVTWSYRFTQYIYGDENLMYGDHQSVGGSIINNVVPRCTKRIQNEIQSSQTYNAW